MSIPTHHAPHEHASSHAHLHTPPPDADAAYRRAYDAAQPDPGRSVVRVDLDVRECDWSVASGRSVRAWSYNGSVPGPVIEAYVGDVLEVCLTNHLSEPTNVHWHGLRIPAAMDGTESVQRPVAPGESCWDRLQLPHAGAVW